MSLLRCPACACFSLDAVSQHQTDLPLSELTRALLKERVRPCAGLAATHDELRECAIGLVQKCRQAESVNAMLREECQRLRSAQQVGYRVCLTLRLLLSRST